MLVPLPGECPQWMHCAVWRALGTADLTEYRDRVAEIKDELASQHTLAPP